MDAMRFRLLHGRIFIVRLDASSFLMVLSCSFRRNVRCWDESFVSAAAEILLELAEFALRN